MQQRINIVTYVLPLYFRHNAQDGMMINFTYYYIDLIDNITYH